MMTISASNIGKLREIAREFGEDSVTIASAAGVITFDFSRHEEVRARMLPYESQPSRQELAALLKRPVPVGSKL